MRTIDADALIGQLHFITFEDGDDRSLVYAVIQEQKTVEPQRMRGRWIPTEPDEPCFYQCSLCRRLNDATDKFCPNCGARMGEQDGTRD